MAGGGQFCTVATMSVLSSRLVRRLPLPLLVLSAVLLAGRAAARGVLLAEAERYEAFWYAAAPRTQVLLLHDAAAADRLERALSSAAGVLLLLCSAVLAAVVVRRWRRQRPAATVALAGLAATVAGAACLTLTLPAPQLTAGPDAFATMLMLDLAALAALVTAAVLLRRHDDRRWPGPACAERDGRPAVN